MREIKFRAWDKFSKKMIITGFNILGEVNCFQLIEQELSKTKNPIYINDGYYSSLLRLQDVEIMQYTGLKDKNGVEIYEGDIVEVDNYIYKINTECKWGIGQWILLDNSNGGEWTRQLYHEKERLCIIGNIYENPELLK